MGVVLDSGLDPSVVEVLGRLIQDQLEGHPLALVAALDRDKAGGAPLGFLEALAVPAHVAAPRNATLLGDHIPGGNRAQNKATLQAAPEDVAVLVLELLLLVVRARNRLHTIHRERRIVAR